MGTVMGRMGCIPIPILPVNVTFVTVMVTESLGVNEPLVVTLTPGMGTGQIKITINHGKPFVLGPVLDPFLFLVQCEWFNIISYKPFFPVPFKFCLNKS